MNSEEKLALINTWDKWRQTIDLGDDIFSPGFEKDTHRKSKAWELKPEIFADKTVLDIGAWDGFFAFLAEKWGASEVTALDIQLSRGFEIAKQILDSKVKHIVKDIIETKPEDVGTFDVVLFCGVLYHMKFPFFSLHRVANLTKSGGTLILETHALENKPIKVEKFPNSDGVYETDCYMLFYPNDELAGDRCCWNGFTVEGVASMVEDVGFEINKILHSQLPDRYTIYATKVKETVELKDPAIETYQESMTQESPRSSVG